MDSSQSHAHPPSLCDGAHAVRSVMVFYSPRVPSPPVSVRSRVLPCDLTGERASRGCIQPPPAPSSAAVAAHRSRDTVHLPTLRLSAWRFGLHPAVCSARCRRLLGTSRKEHEESGDVIPITCIYIMPSASHCYLTAHTSTALYPAASNT